MRRLINVKCSGDSVSTGLPFYTTGEARPRSGHEGPEGKYSTCSLTSALYGSIYNKYAYKSIWIVKCDLPTIRLAPKSGS